MQSFSFDKVAQRRPDVAIDRPDGVDWCALDDFDLSIRAYDLGSDYRVDFASGEALELTQDKMRKSKLKPDISAELFRASHAGISAEMPINSGDTILVILRSDGLLQLIQQ